MKGRRALAADLQKLDEYAAMHAERDIERQDNGTAFIVHVHGQTAIHIPWRDADLRLPKTDEPVKVIGRVADLLDWA